MGVSGVGVDTTSGYKIDVANELKVSNTCISSAIRLDVIIKMKLRCDGRGYRRMDSNTIRSSTDGLYEAAPLPPDLVIRCNTDYDGYCFLFIISSLSPPPSSGLSSPVPGIHRALRVQCTHDQFAFTLSRIFICNYY